MDSRMKRIARELEKLPCELHEGVLVHLELEQLVRLSKFAGPRMVWSLENNQFSMGLFLRGGNWTQWHQLLQLTGEVRKRCLPINGRSRRY